MGMMGAAIGGGGALLGTLAGGGVGGEEGGIQKTSTLSPEQQELIKKLAPYLQERIGQGLPGYTGEFVAPLSEYEQMGLGQLGKYLTGPSALTEYGLGQYKEALAGLSPEQTEEWYSKYIAPQEKKYWEEEVIPGVREAYVGPGTFWGTPRAEAEAGSWETFGTQQLGRIGEAIMSERAGARGMLPYLGEMAGLEGGMPQIEAAMTYGAVPRLIQQAELSSQIQEFIRTTPELSPILNQVLQLLGIQTQAAYYQEPQASPFMQLLGAVAPGVGYGLGSMMAGGGTAAAAAPAAAAASDIRLKENIRKIGETLKGLGVYVWKWKDWTKNIIGNTPSIGVIAQEVMRVIPEAVFRGKHGFLMVDYSKLG